MTARSQPAGGDRMKVTAVPDCRRCGACCFSSDPRYVRVTGDDHARLEELAEIFTRFIGNRCYLRIAGDRCAALQVDAEAGLFRCRVYEQRPQVCRDLLAGSPHCEAERARKAGRARRALEG
jgi:Fe-S-cluster containining protein